MTPEEIARGIAAEFLEAEDGSVRVGGKRFPTIMPSTMAYALREMLETRIATALTAERDRLMAEWLNGWRACRADAIREIRARRDVAERIRPHSAALELDHLAAFLEHLPEPALTLHAGVVVTAEDVARMSADGP